MKAIARIGEETLPGCTGVTETLYICTVVVDMYPD